MFLRKNEFVNAELLVDNNRRTATFTYDGQSVGAQLSGYVGLAGGSFSFGARTAAANDNQWIDDLRIDAEGNSAGGLGTDCKGTFVSAGYNLVGNSSGSTGLGGAGDQLNVNPLIAPLQDNGGPAFTHALLPGSPAIDKGLSLSFVTDQRGGPRTVSFPDLPNAPGGNGSDIGAVEAGGYLRITDLRTNGPQNFGPDTFQLSVRGGPTLIRSTFSTYTRQSYPGTLTDNYPAITGAVEINTLGYTHPNLDPADALYRLTATVNHTASSVMLDFSSLNLQDIADESWGLDNVRVEASTLS